MALASQAGALTLGASQGRVVLGEPLDVALTIQSHDNTPAQALCPSASVQFGNVWLHDSLLQIDTPSANTLRVRTRNLVKEPQVTLLVTAGCAAKASRTYSFLATLPTQVAGDVPVFQVPPPESQVVAQADDLLPPARARTSQSATTAAVSMPDAALPALPATRPSAAVPPARGTASDAAPPVPAAAASALPVAAPAVAQSPEAQPAQSVAPAEVGAASAVGGGAAASGDTVVPGTMPAGGTPSDDMPADTQPVTGGDAQPAADPVEPALSQHGLADAGQPSIPAPALIPPDVMPQDDSSGSPFALPVDWAPIALPVLLLLLLVLLLLIRLRNKAATRSQEYASADVTLAQMRQQQPPVGQPARATPWGAAVAATTAAEATVGDLAGGATVASAPVGEAVAALDVPQKETLDKVLEQAKFHAAVGQHDQAIGLLENYIANKPDNPALAYLELLQLLHHLGRSQPFERERQKIQALFNVDVPTFGSFAEGGGHSLCDVSPETLARIQALWPQDVVQILLHDLIARPAAHAGGQAPRFGLVAFKELLTLQHVVQSRPVAERGDLQDHIRTTPDPALQAQQEAPATVEQPAAASVSDKDDLEAGLDALARPAAEQRPAPQPEPVTGPESLAHNPAAMLDLDALERVLATKPSPAARPAPVPPQPVADTGPVDMLDLGSLVAKPAAAASVAEPPVVEHQVHEGSEPFPADAFPADDGPDTPAEAVTAATDADAATQGSGAADPATNSTASSLGTTSAGQPEAASSAADSLLPDLDLMGAPSTVTSAASAPTPEEQAVSAAAGAEAAAAPFGAGQDGSDPLAPAPKQG